MRTLTHHMSIEALEALHRRRSFHLREDSGYRLWTGRQKPTHLQPSQH